jgi:3-oxoacyl-[acyl-carrier protein] reductase
MRVWLGRVARVSSLLTVQTPTKCSCMDGRGSSIAKVLYERWYLQGNNKKTTTVAELIRRCDHGHRQRNQRKARPHNWCIRRVRTTRPASKRRIIEPPTHSIINKHRIGAACARDLLANGTSLALTYSTNKNSLSDLVTDLNASKGDRRISTHQCDVAKEGDLQRLFDEIKESHGKNPDIVVANAGYGKRVSNILELDIEEWDYTINVNLRSSFIITKLAVPHMQAQGWGRVIYISSIAAGGTSINGCHYSASKGRIRSFPLPWSRSLTRHRNLKAGVQGMSKNLAQKMGKSGITFNDVAPAMITGTGMIQTEEQLKGTPGDVKNIPVGRSGSTEECANVVTMLCRTGYMTGQSLLLSGGLK